MRAAQHASGPAQQRISTTSSEVSRASVNTEADTQSEADRKRAAEDGEQRKEEEKKAEEYAEQLKKIKKMNLKKLKEELEKLDAQEDAIISSDLKMLQEDNQAAERRMKEFVVDSDVEDAEQQNEDDNQNQEDEKQ